MSDSTSQDASTRENSTTIQTTESKPKSRSRKRSSFLTEEEKKKHHIESEHKRREAIRNAFLNLTNIVPDLTQSDSRSELLVLDKSAEYLMKLYKENEQLVRSVELKGGKVSTSTKIGFPNGEPDLRRS